jgi:hypothetical protein
MSYSQEFIDMKLAAIRECQTRPARRISPGPPKGPSAAELRAQEASKRNQERRAKKDAEEKIKAEKLARQRAAKLLQNERANSIRPNKGKKVKKITPEEEFFEPKKEPGFKPEQKRERSFKTRPLNLDEKIKVEVKKGLWVYVDPGSDIEAVKAKYNKPAAKTFLNEHEKAMAKKRGLIDGDREAYQF